MSKKPAAKKDPPPKAPKRRQTPTPSKKKQGVSFEEDDDVEDLAEAFSRTTVIDRGSNFSLNGSHAWKRCGYIKVRMHNNTEIRYYEQRVDVFVGFPVSEQDLKVELSSCGNFVHVQTKIPSWFGSNKHYRAEYRAVHGANAAFPISESQNTALLETAQEIRDANPDMDELERLSHPTQTIPLSFQCKLPVMELRIIHLPCRDVTVTFNGANVATFYFVVSFKLFGTKQIKGTKPQPVQASVNMDTWNDLYD